MNLRKRRQTRTWLTSAATALAITASGFTSQAMAELNINIAYLGQPVDQGPVLSNILPTPEDAGLRGAELGIKDSNTTGRFLKQKYQLTEVIDEDGAALIEHAKALYADQSVRAFVVNAPASTLMSISQALPEDV